MMIFQLATKNLLVQKKRYVLMAIAIAAGFFLMTVLSSLMQGALDTIRSKSARYFSGQICLYGYIGDEKVVETPDVYLDILRDSSLPLETVAKRSILESRFDTMLFFNGSYVRIRKTIGVDFDDERKQLEKLPFIEGGIADGLLVSRAITDDIGAHVGDNVTISITTDSGQVNTITVPISGIFDEVNLFGYSVYLNRSDVNTLGFLPTDFVSEIALYTKKGAQLRPLETKIRNLLSPHAMVLPEARTRRELSNLLDTIPEQGNTLAVVSIDAQLEQITLLLFAFEICMYIILLIFMLITSVGIVNTYRVIIFNRMGEIGTIRAIGVQRKTILQVFLLEAIILSFFSSLVGFLLAIVTLLTTNVFTLTGNPAVNMFTEYNKLQYTILPENILVNLILITVSVLLAVWNPSRQAATIAPAEALRKI